MPDGNLAHATIAAAQPGLAASLSTAEQAAAALFLSQSEHPHDIRLNLSAPMNQCGADALLVGSCRTFRRHLREQAIAADATRAFNEGEEGAAEADAKLDQISGRCEYTLQDICNTPSSTPFGVRAKAALIALLDPDRDDTDIVRLAVSLARDVLGLPAVPEAMPFLTSEPLAERRELLSRYSAWLFMERRLLLIEIFGEKDSREAERFVPSERYATAFHFPADQSWKDAPQPSTRAVQVMGAAGVFLGPEGAVSPEMQQRAGA